MDYKGFIDAKSNGYDYQITDKGISFIDTNGNQVKFYYLWQVNNFYKVKETIALNNKKREKLAALHEKEPLNIGKLLSFSNHSEKDYDLMRRGTNICQDLGINEYDLDLSKNTCLYSQFIFSWYCTDTWVGVRAFYLNEELVCVAYQLGRKYDSTFHWVSQETKTKTRDYLNSLRAVEEEDIWFVGWLDLESDYLVEELLNDKDVVININI